MRKFLLKFRAGEGEGSREEGIIISNTLCANSML